MGYGRLVGSRCAGWLDLAPRVLPELDPRLSATADRVLRERGVQVLTRTSVDEATTRGLGARRRPSPPSGAAGPGPAPSVPLDTSPSR